MNRRPRRAPILASALAVISGVVALTVIGGSLWFSSSSHAPTTGAAHDAEDADVAEASGESATTPDQFTSPPTPPSFARNSPQNGNLPSAMKETLFTPPNLPFQQLLSAHQCSSEDADSQLADFLALYRHVKRISSNLGLLSEMAVLPALHAVFPTDRRFTYVDIGANVGQSSALVLHLFGRPLLERLELGVGDYKWEAEHTYQPDVYSVELIAANVVSLNQLRDELPPMLKEHYRVLEFGISNRTTTLCVEGSGVLGNQQARVHVGGDASAPGAWPPGTLHARLVSFMEFWNTSRVESASLVKIDTEGHDPIILRAMEPVLAAKLVDMVVFEFHHLEGWKTTTLEEVVAWLEALDYDSYLIGDFRLYKLSSGCWRSGYGTKYWSNVLVMRRGLTYGDALLKEYHRTSCRDIPPWPRRPTKKLCWRFGVVS